MTEKAADYLRSEVARPLCGCGDPACVYVKNLLTLVEDLEALAAANRPA